MKAKSTFTLGKLLLPQEARIMHRFLTATLVVALVAAVATSPVLAKTHTFKVRMPCSINGTQLEPGTYKLKLNANNEAEIYRGKDRVVTAKVEVKPLTNSRTRGSVLRGADGSISEIRLKRQVAVFVR